MWQNHGQKLTRGTKTAKSVKINTSVEINGGSWGSWVISWIKTNKSVSIKRSVEAKINIVGYNKNTHQYRSLHILTRITSIQTIQTQRGEYMEQANMIMKRGYGCGAYRRVWSDRTALQSHCGRSIIMRSPSKIFLCRNFLSQSVYFYEYSHEPEYVT